MRKNKRNEFEACSYWPNFSGFLMQFLKIIWSIARFLYDNCVLVIYEGH